MATQGGKYFTMVYAVLDTETGALDYTLAGQPPPIVVRRDAGAEQLDGSGFPVGIVDDADFDAYSLQLEPGDRVFFYSDGITEANNREGTMLGSAGLVRLIDACRDRPLDECVAQCLDGLRDWSEPVPFNDDVSLLAAEVPAP